MDDVPPRPLSAVLGDYRPAPASRRRLLLLGVLAGFWCLLAVLQTIDGAWWRAGCYGLMAVVWVHLLRSERRPRPATVITPEGLRVRRWTGRWRQVPWADVERVSLVRDAQGSSAVRLVDGAEVRLVGVPQDVVQVLAAHVGTLRAVG